MRGTSEERPYLLSELESAQRAPCSASARGNEIIQETAALADHREKATLGVVVLLVNPEVLVELVSM